MQTGNLNRLNRVFESLEKECARSTRDLVLLKLLGKSAQAFTVLRQLLVHAGNNGVCVWHDRLPKNKKFGKGKVSCMFFSKNAWEYIWGEPEVPRAALRVLAAEGLIDHCRAYIGCHGTSVNIVWPTLLSRVQKECKKLREKDSCMMGVGSSVSGVVLRHAMDVPMYTFSMVFSRMIEEAYTDEIVRTQLLTDIGEMNKSHKNNNRLCSKLHGYPTLAHERSNIDLEPSSLLLMHPKYPNSPGWHLKDRVRETLVVLADYEARTALNPWDGGPEVVNRLEKKWWEDSLNLAELQFIGACLQQWPELRDELKSLSNVLRNISDCTVRCRGYCEQTLNITKDTYSINTLITNELLTLGWMEMKLCGPHPVTQYNLLKKMVIEFDGYFGVSPIQKFGIYNKIYPYDWSSIQHIAALYRPEDRPSVKDIIKNLTRNETDVFNAMYPTVLDKLNTLNE